MVSLKQLLGLELRAQDGIAGRVSYYLIDEGTWTVGHAAVPVGGILSGEHRTIAFGELSLDRQKRALITTRSLLELTAISPTDLITKGEEGWASLRNETSQMKPAGVPPEWRSFNAMLGCNISASDGIYGSLSDLLVELDQWRIQYFGRFHSWKKKSTVIIPTASVEQVSWMDESVEVSPSREALARQQSYKPTSHTH